MYLTCLYILCTSDTTFPHNLFNKLYYIIILLLKIKVADLRRQFVSLKKIFQAYRVGYENKGF